jgi:hypothetical protein
VFRPPAPKPDPKPQSIVTNKPAESLATKAPEPPPPAPIALFADTTSQTPEPKTLSEDYAPYGRLIACETVITVDSSSIRTPIIGLIIEDIYPLAAPSYQPEPKFTALRAPDRVRERWPAGLPDTGLAKPAESLEGRCARP